MTGNYAFGHRQGAFIFFTQGTREAMRTTYIKSSDVATLKDQQAGSLPEWIHTDAAPIWFSNNAAAGCERGVEVWYHNRFSPHDTFSVLQDSVFWNHWQVAPTPLPTLSGDVMLPYSKNVLLRNLRMSAL